MNEICFCLSRHWSEQATPKWDEPLRVQPYHTNHRHSNFPTVDEPLEPTVLAENGNLGSMRCSAPRAGGVLPPGPLYSPVMHPHESVRPVKTVATG